MKLITLSGLTALLTVTTSYAQSVANNPGNPSSVNSAAANQSADSAAKASQEVAEVKAMFEEIYADMKAKTSPGTGEILAIGTGAGLGFLASSFIMTAWAAPVVASLSSSLGLSPAASGIVTASVTTIGIVTGTYAGGVYARDLISR